MKREVKNTIKQLSVGLMILIMAVLLVNKAVYTHLHVMPNGSVLTHAHPFNKTNDSKQGKSHHHSNLELFLIQGLELMMLFAAVVLTLISLDKEIEKRWFLRKYYITALIPLKQGRAPPSFV